MDQFALGVIAGWGSVCVLAWLLRRGLSKLSDRMVEGLFVGWLRGLSATSPVRGFWVRYYRGPMPADRSRDDNRPTAMVCVAWEDLARAIETEDLDVQPEARPPDLN